MKNDCMDRLKREVGCGETRGERKKVEEKREEKEGEKTEPPKPPSTSAMKQMLGHESESLVERHSYPKIKSRERLRKEKGS